MTDDTQPEALRLALSIDLMDTFTDYQQEELDKAAAELRRQHARIAELEAVEAGGVQALSAAPEAIAKLRHLYQNMVNGAVRDTASAKRIAEGLLAPAIEALERATPTAEQQAPPGAVGRTGCTAGTDEECTRRGCATTCPAQQEAPKAVPGDSAASLVVPDDCPHILWFDDQDLKPAVFAGNGAKRAALEAYRQASMQWNAHLFVRIAVNSRDCLYPCAAPQQEAQEPAPSAAAFGWRLVPVEPTDQMVQAAHHIDLSYMPGQEGADRAAIYRALIAAAPQPAPAPLSEREAFEAWIEKDGGDLGTFGTPPNMHYRNSSVNNAWVAWKARAALAAQGGKV